MNTLSKIDKLLNEEKNKLDNLEIPEDIELKLRDSLNNIPERRKKSLRGRIAAVVIIVLLLSYNIDTLAYYGKKLLGYDTVMNATLQELNELGKGQLIGKTHTFSDGVSVTLDGAMLDDNNLILFYTLEDPENNIEDMYSKMNIGITGFADSLGYGGHGETDREGKVQRWVMRTDRTPRFYENNIGLRIEYTPLGKDIEIGEIQFKLDRNAAVGKSISISLNKKIKPDNRSIKVDTIVFSPTSTVVRGEIQNIFELSLDYMSDNIFRPRDLEMILLADGKEVQIQSSGMSSGIKGIQYDMSFDAIPANSKEIELKLKSFGGEHKVDKAFIINKEETKDLDVLKQQIKIEDVYEDRDNTYITFTTEENTILSRVYLNIDGLNYEVKETISGAYEKVVEGDSAKTFYTRTMRFEGKGDKFKLDIQRIIYSKDYDITIYSNK